MSEPKGPFRCPGCGKTTGGGLPHCGECGFPLVRKCAACGAKWRFIFEYKCCPACGKGMAAEAVSSRRS